MTGRRDPEGRRRAIIEAACALIPEVGVGGLTHRVVAARAGVPLGATTYYFTSLDDLSQTARSAAESLRAWRRSLRAGDDVADTMAALTEEYLADRGRALTETELYLAAVRRPELRPLARTWFDGLVGLLGEYADPAAAAAAVFLIDGALPRALGDQQPLDTAGLATALRAVLRPAP
ncbi:TetR family transcriptional regulator [Actinoallomurus sp. NBC_01490]|uniref:TetR/AcrR family transcriptional regulator n=1 Tax=Actinoallomurus sp. NBC_01490 TaxID=2903557 RepID=UPI002E363E77|nr:TetR family transcriptional regulator [Actinoallomurus sp. NBC_01490]